jgi:hypothetical protein
MDWHFIGLMASFFTLVFLILLWGKTATNQSWQSLLFGTIDLKNQKPGGEGEV